MDAASSLHIWLAGILDPDSNASSILLSTMLLDTTKVWELDVPSRYFSIRCLPKGLPTLDGRNLSFLSHSKDAKTYIAERLWLHSFCAYISEWFNVLKILNKMMKTKFINIRIFFLRTYITTSYEPNVHCMGATDFTDENLFRICKHSVSNFLHLIGSFHFLYNNQSSLIVI